MNTHLNKKAINSNYINYILMKKSINDKLLLILSFLDYLIKSNYYSINIFISSSTFVIPPIPKFSTRTFATLGERKAGNVGPR